eukprot:TRINITY_DN1232_c0_g1_i1.p1 TRINITY_DN1232_c0_g1~~TRINITY_DN1232_c0_g1_i1.p1  ORF type:complete len:171 (+),score=25.53 TRINITY_DN1232_c0_g1_i1:115-627(+)
MAVFIPPTNWGMVEEDLYRCGQPNVLNFPFLEKLNLKSVIFLAPYDPSPQFMSFMEDQGIALHNLGSDSSKTPNPWGGNTISEDMAISALKLIMEPKNYPLAVMCNLGRHRTGTIIGCLRKLQRWNLTSIFEEYRRHAGAKVRLLNEQFIELFDTDLVSLPPPDDRPKWL